MLNLKDYLKLPLFWVLLISDLVSLFWINSFDLVDLTEYENRDVFVKGDICSDIDYSSESVRIFINVNELCALFNGDFVECKSINSKIVTWLPRYPKVWEGSNITIYGKLTLPQDFENSENFSYRDYLLSKGVNGVIYRPSSYELYKSQRGLKSGLIRVREWAISRLSLNVPEPHSSLLIGILLGVEGTMPESFNLALRCTGTTHIIAASGYNVTIIANSIISILSFLSRKVRLLLSIGFIWVFVFISGCSIPVLRAAFMLSYSLIAKVLGRKSLVFISLLFSASVLIILDPETLASISFQLSFASTLGLMYLEPVLSQSLVFLPSWLRESVSVTLAAILSTLPITLYNFGELPILALPVNILVLPVVELVMSLGVVYLIIPLWLAPLRNVLSLVLWIPLDYFVRVVYWFGNFSFSSIKVEFFNGYFVVFYYLIVFLVIIFGFKIDDDQE